jgi:hypothetical protein
MGVAGAATTAAIKRGEAGDSLAAFVEELIVSDQLKHIAGGSFCPACEAKNRLFDWRMARGADPRKGG